MLELPAPADAAAVRRYFFDYAEELLRLYLAQVRRAELRLTKSLLARGRELSIAWNLNSQDGVMLAVAETAARSAGYAPHMATFDEAFREIDGLHVWGLASR